MSVKNVILCISVNSPCVLAGCQIRRKEDYSLVKTMRRSTLLKLFGGGYAEIRDGRLCLTPKGQRELHTPSEHKSRSAAYSQRVRDRGCIRKSIWVHPDDIERFEDFVATMKGPMDE